MSGGRYPAAEVCRVLQVSRSNVLERRGRGKDRRGRAPNNDPVVIKQLIEVASVRPAYGYRRLWALLRRARRKEGLLPVNAKRVYRLADEHHLLL